ncbi:MULTISPECIES: hypothetical protein [unclassified Microcoleus]|uniref:hypothetical protein n=1 Tax=unclassified Microcoleus TaxID=2642155 RepID=UPI001D46D30E|nr:MULTISPECIES: hypothetical protein [unclassified Microcoleus]MCC3444694.1 hypothetical protein [Microcoleus sp. PH2017_03_ELD_O_A]MCC3469215.1 hypothetical protein [Microcoleus sp. PH2017_06_SFM_O_A]MCC3507361.1 hypothetical protein [Microcoleus sp. PH2017_19_SFW_U_A]TAE62700.1 MAG: hypothetical protein EAZ86_30465 [Oscillatoriales cyanobacterium]MCC3416138.1 hypothetical protein [Microcoleus sp. PH2017_02_FOX_O_A]
MISVIRSHISLFIPAPQKKQSAQKLVSEARAYGGYANEEDRPLAVESDRKPRYVSNLPSSCKNINLHPPTSNSLCYSNHCDY